jgi:hypothetical protein
MKMGVRLKLSIHDLDSKFHTWRRWIVGVGGLLVAFNCSTVGWSQGCSMCYNSAASAKASAIEALKHGILILLIPPLAMFIGIFALAFRRRNGFNQNVDDTNEWREVDELPAPVPHAQAGMLPLNAQEGRTEAKVRI